MYENLDLFMGVDKKKEIFNLLYEITYLRNLFTHLLQHNPELAICMDQAAFDKARMEAQKIVKERFPMCDIQFSEH